MTTQKKQDNIENINNSNIDNQEKTSVENIEKLADIPLIEKPNENHEMLSSDNAQRFKDTSIFIEVKTEPKKEKKHSRLVTLLLKHKLCSQLVPFVESCERGVQKLQKWMRFDGLFSKILWLNVTLNATFFISYIIAQYLFFTSNLFLLPVFFLLLSLVIWQFQEKSIQRTDGKIVKATNKWQRYLFEFGYDEKRNIVRKGFNKHNGMTLIVLAIWIAMMFLTSLYPFDNLYQSEFSARTIETFYYSILLAMPFLAYHITRRHVISTLLISIAFISSAQKPENLVDWNLDWNNPKSIYYTMPALKAQLYIAHKTVASLEKVKVINFTTLNNIIPYQNWGLQTRALYQYRLSNDVVQRIKNAKCAKLVFDYCETSQDKLNRLPKYNINNLFVSNFKEFDIYMEYRFRKAQETFAKELTIPNDRSLQQRSVLSDLSTIYNADVMKKLRLELGLSDINAEFDEIDITIKPAYY